jgi:hypothetical protein
MKVAATAFLLLILFPNFGTAAQVYGTLRELDRPVAANIRIEIVCGGNVYPAVTDNYGSYKLFARETGKCTFRVYYQNQVPQMIIDSYTDAAHYDFDLVRQTDGRYQLKRK